jgi:1-acyl-sn-glycerol-3-phosphate acyltransferase
LDTFLWLGTRADEVHCHSPRQWPCRHQAARGPGKARLDEGIWIVIFPEGTRIPPGQQGQYRIGGAVLAEQSGYPIIPVAHNAGEYWSRRSFIKRPGVIQVRIGKPIETTGKSAQQLLDEAAGWIEARMAEITTLK